VLDQDLQMGCFDMQATREINRFTKQKGMIGILRTLHLIPGLAELGRSSNPLIQEYLTNGSALNQVDIPGSQFDTID